MATYTKTMTQKEINALYNRIKPILLSESKPPYTLFSVKTNECTITAYQSGKVVFQGKNLDWLTDTSNEPTKNIYPQAGSDEVGTGDYFGPVVVASCIVEEKNVEHLKSLGIQDSKQINDDKIKQLAPIIKKKCPHSILILSNQKYNKIHESHNMVDIKCQMHNQAYINLIHKGYNLPKSIIIDQFVQEKNYYRYLAKKNHVIKNIHFETKAENKYLSVACASILARNALLESFEKMENVYHFKFEKGAGSKVDSCAKKFINQFGQDALPLVAKIHFKNTEKALDM